MNTDPALSAPLWLRSCPVGLGPSPLGYGHEYTHQGVPDGGLHWQASVQRPVRLHSQWSFPSGTRF